MANNPAAFSAIIAQISSNTIAVVDLSGAGLNSSDMTILVNALKNNSSVNILHLNGNNIKVNGLSQVIDLIQSNTPLGMITLDTANLDNSDAIAVAAALRNNKNLFAIVMNYNAITVTGASALVESIAQHPKITHVQLSGNAIGDAAAIRLASLPTITTLLLNDCSLTTAGTRGVLEGVRNQQCMIDLRLDGNQFNPASLQLLSEALAKGSPLQSLWLQRAGLGNYVINAIFPYLEQSSLRYLYLTDNPTNDIPGPDLIFVLQRSKTLIDLNISGTGILLDQFSLDQINGILAHNKNYPYLTPTLMLVAQGNITTLTPVMLQASSSRAGVVAQNIQYTIIDAQNCQFLLRGRPVTQFYQRDIDAGLVQVWHDGSYV
ncbi:MAG: hypothetical protein K5Q00_04570, partial [Gammaproteobacteria bacterium]|nr:hypothetical protein [Gammaproteobacteria bacterium]